jgi:hypothetical protein
MRINGKITILINREDTTIELTDSDASITFAKIRLTVEQLSSALSRLAYTECDIELNGLEKLGKKMQHKEFEFELPRQNMSQRDSKELTKIANKLLSDLNEGWSSDTYFGSQNTFFVKDGKTYARCTIRRWV